MAKLRFRSFLTPQQKASKQAGASQNLAPKEQSNLGIPDPKFIFDTQTQTQSTSGKKITRARARKIQRSTERESALMAAAAAAVR